MIKLLLTEPFGSVMVLNGVNLFFAAVCVMSFAAFVAVGADKLRAIRRKRRVPERSLLCLSLFLGGVGGMLAMLLFRHKTKKPLFKLVYLFGVLQLALALFLLLKPEIFG